MPPRLDLSKLREDRQKLSAQPPALAPEVPNDAADMRRRLQDQRSALNAEASPPGQEPEADPVDRAMAAGKAHPRGSDQAMGAYFDEMAAAAMQGDQRAASQGVVDGETRDRWHEAARQRQVANREKSGMYRR